MDAKAKVVAWRYRRDGATKWAYTDIPLEAGAALGSMEHETQELTTLTDHEAALAELVAENRRLKVENKLKTRAIDRWVPCPDHRDKTNDQGCYMCQLERENKRTEQLLTGLEALAGEIKEQVEKLDAGGAYIIGLSWLHEKIDELTTLASSATGEKNTEEETKS